MKNTMQDLLNGKNLSTQQAYDLFANLSNVSIEQQAAILTAMAIKTETHEEIIGARNFIFSHSIKIASPYNIIDIVGTGGDGIGTFNISTAASLVMSSAGAMVAKHGGRASSSLSGSTDVMEQLGIPLPSNSTEVLTQLSTAHYAYLPASCFNPLLKNFALLRKKLGFPTIFNVLGPLLHPLQPKRMVLGVYRRDLVLKMAQVLQTLGVTRALVVHSEDKLDEISISAKTHIAEIKNNQIQAYQISPEEVGLTRAPINEVLGGSPLENAKIMNAIFTGELHGPKLDIVLFNAAAGLMVAEIANDFKEGIAIARECIASGKIVDLMQQLKKFTYFPPINLRSG